MELGLYTSLRFHHSFNSSVLQSHRPDLNTSESQVGMGQGAHLLAWAWQTRCALALGVPPWPSLSWLAAEAVTSSGTVAPNTPAPRGGRGGSSREASSGVTLWGSSLSPDKTLLPDLPLLAPTSLCSIPLLKVAGQSGFCYLQLNTDESWGTPEPKLI